MSPSDDQISLAFNDLRLERLADRRKDVAWLQAAVRDPASRLLVVREGDQVPVGRDGGLAWRPVAGVSEPAELLFLGVDSQSRALFACDLADAGAASNYVPFREVGVSLSREDAAAALEALALTTWHRRHLRCARCGASTEMTEAGHVRRCPQCETDHFPRMDPAVIMLVTDGERCVLGRRVAAPQGRWSALAGFIDPGESAEDAVVREVREESGLAVTSVAYRGSQPWPFPASLMLAFEARAEYGPITLSEEHEDVRWFTRSELREAISSGSVVIAGSVSAGNFLIRSWLG